MLRLASARSISRLALGAWLCLGARTPAQATQPPATPQTPAPAPADATGPEEAKPEPVPEGPPRWRFKKKDRKVKVIVLAGSIGARPTGSYSHHIEAMCKNAEVQNLSKTGYGVAKLAVRFDERALRNRYAKLNVPEHEYWLVFGGGLNSVGVPERSNHAMRKLFTKVHAKGFSVLALSLTPWGSDKDTRRWAGVAGLKYLDATQKIVDFVMGRLSPSQALGSYTKYRKDLDPSRFSAQELPDLAIDLFDSPLRHYGAKARKSGSMRQRIARNRYWKQTYKDLSDQDKQRQLDIDTKRVLNIPQFYLHPKIHSFDAIHPNAKGHKLMADLICPSLPASWGCNCEPPKLLPK